MAQRRMFSPQIIDSDAFLDMPSSAQSLYFHLGMRADDDGFVGNPRKILKIINSSEDDLRILLAKAFILTFESGIIVIKHWRINNLIRKDWYKETAYLEEKAQLNIKENGSYSLSKEAYDKEENAVFVNENVTKPTHRLGKVSLDKNTIDFEKFWNIYPKKVEKKKSEVKWNSLKLETQELILKDLPERIKCEQWQKGFILNPMTYLNGERWNDQIVNPTAARTTERWVPPVDDRAPIDSVGRQKFNQMKEAFKLK
jgi:hypothetical protein